jgi:diguanylate cyclase (GGDEF)-like protein
VPIIVTSDERMSRGARLAALEAGAWLTLTYPFDAEELIAQLSAYAPARRSITQIEEASLVDPNTKLYSRQGLEQRARELHAQAGWHREPLACVIFTPVPTQGAVALTEAVSLWGRALKAAGRQSDAIGRYGEAEFAVLAPNTNVDGVLTMARRLAAVLRSSSTVKGERRFEVQAGYEPRSYSSTRRWHWQAPGAMTPGIGYAGMRVGSVCRERSGGAQHTSASVAFLLHGDALGKVARLVNVTTPQHGNVICQQLQRNGRHDR